MQYLETHEVSWRCNCDRERIAALLKGLGKEELEDIREKEGHSEVICHFCNERYLFTDEELTALIEELAQE